ncbi:MAG: hypothetical protein LUG99_00330 [Lachnospiraceae bacterium]|nr:hypothetical protein [Lachnospiraceae bacterium]
MTNQEAIDIITNGRHDMDTVNEALELAVAALQRQEEIPCSYNLDAVMEQLDGAAITRFEGRLKDGRICHYEDIKYIVRTGGELPK